MLLQALLLFAFPALAVLAAARDATSYTIPNWISLALTGTFLAAGLACGLAPAAIGSHALVGVVALVIGMGMFAAGWLGGGDVKFFAATALWLGWPLVTQLLLVTAVAGGLLTGLLLLLRSAPVRARAAQGPAWVARLATPGESVPYGLAIAAGALLAFPGSPAPAAFLLG